MRSVDSGRESGQVEVETAIVLPVVTFLLLGLIQLGLLHQARLVAEYAAYRAVRHGALRVATSQANWIADMEFAGLAAALPVLSRRIAGAENLARTDSVENYLNAWNRPGFRGMNRMVGDTNMKYIDVKICGPLKGDVQSHTYTAHGTEYVPFDDPALYDGSTNSVLRTKLRIELTLNYRMIIPFADWVIYYMFRGWKYSEDIHLGYGEQDAAVGGDGMADYDMAALNHDVYIMPLYTQYAMKLMSDVPLNNFPSDSQCKK